MCIRDRHHFAISLDATRNFWLFMSMFVVIVVLSVGLYLDWRSDRSRYDNDLKYRYVLMKGCLLYTSAICFPKAATASFNPACCISMKTTISAFCWQQRKRMLPEQ